jgi:hypothetical protein
MKQRKKRRKNEEKNGPLLWIQKWKYFYDLWFMIWWHNWLYATFIYYVSCV